MPATEAGSRARSRMEAVHAELRGHLANALKIKFETQKAQKRAIDRAISLDGKAGGSDDYKLDKEHQYWPFDGEYWKDELDSYTVGIKSRCATKGAGK